MHYKWEFPKCKLKQIKCKNKSLTKIAITIYYHYNFKDVKIPYIKWKFNINHTKKSVRIGYKI